MLLLQLRVLVLVFILVLVDIVEVTAYRPGGEDTHLLRLFSYAGNVWREKVDRTYAIWRFSIPVPGAWRRRL